VDYHKNMKEVSDQSGQSGDFSIVFAKIERVTEPVNGEVRVAKYKNGDKHVIHIGNTGLKVAIDRQPHGALSASADYEPEGKTQYAPENQVRYTTLFAYSLSKLIQWTKNSPESGQEVSLLNTGITFKSLSQPELAGLIKKMLKRHGHPEILQEIGSEQQKEWISLDLPALMKLGEDDPLIQFLHKMETRGSRLNVTYDKVID